MNLVEAMCAGPAAFQGRGRNHEGEHFIGRLAIEALVGGTALLLRYTATGEAGEPLHEEATLLALGEQGTLCLWPVMKELPFVLPHPELSRAEREGACRVVFASGPRDSVEAFREEITIELKVNSELVFTHAWGMPGGAFEARSSCTLQPAAA